MRRRAFLEMLYPESYLRSFDTGELAARTGSIVGRDLAEFPPVLMKQVRALGAHDGSARLRELASIPTLVISATGDRIAHPRYGRALAAAIPGASYEEFPNSSHGVTIQEAKKINDRLRRFFRDGSSVD
jgi:aminoacrylate hydrolase